MYNKTIIRFRFCDIQNNQSLGKGYQPQPSASAYHPYLDLDYSGYHKNLYMKIEGTEKGCRISRVGNLISHFSCMINKLRIDRVNVPLFL